VLSRVCAFVLARGSVGPLAAPPPVTVTHTLFAFDLLHAPID
jgi:hypothetical protein